MYCHQLHCSLSNPAQSFELTSSAVQRYPVWSSPMKYIHVQRSTVFVSFIWKRAMHFGAHQSSEMQWTDCPVWHFPVQLRIVQSGEVKLRLRPSSPIRYSAVHFSLLKCFGLVHFSPVHSADVYSIRVWSGPVHWVESVLVQSSPVLSNSVCSRLIPFIPF